VWPAGVCGPCDAGFGHSGRQVDPNSQRLQLLAPFAKWDGGDVNNAAVLIKAKARGAALPLLLA